MKLLPRLCIVLLIGGLLSPLGSCKHQPTAPTSILDTTTKDTTHNGGTDTTHVTDTTHTGDTTHVTHKSDCNPDSVYFDKQIFPILSANCVTNCHDGVTLFNGRKLDEDYTDYSHTVSRVLKGSAIYSKLYTTLIKTDTTRMPKNRDAFPQEIIDLIKKWIDQGAQNLHCDMCDTSNVTFKSSVMPIIQSTCTGCHSGTTPLGKLTLKTYDDVKKIATSGSLLESILAVGTAGKYDQMPPTTRLGDCDIAKIKIWLKAGAPNN